MIESEEQREQKALVKQAMKEAYKEVLQENYAKVGRWAVGSVVFAVLGLVLYWVAIKSGWTPPA